MISHDGRTGRDANLTRYRSAEVVDHYARAAGLHPAEVVLFARYLRPGMDLIDIGVGGGRTTPHLSSLARNYVGIDVSSAMISVCQAKHPGLRFEVCDARDLGSFPDESFDAAVFSFNGIDYLATDTDRARCLAEIGRVLKAGGVFIFSSHNAKALLVAPHLESTSGWRVLWRLVRSVGKSIQLATRHLRTGVFQSGAGYIWDPHHGGLWTYLSTPDALRPQLGAADLSLLEVITDRNPNGRATYTAPWHHYVCRKALRE